MTFNYVVWFGILYLIASYIRLYPKEIFGKTGLWGALSAVSLLLSWGSVLLCTYQDRQAEISGNSYFYVADSNKILAVVTGICLFMFFKNVKIPQSRFINTVASSCFGVLLIHANSDTMRQWLWKDLLNNTGMYDSALLPVHAVLSVLCIFVVCVVIDQLRINLLEKPVTRKLEKRRQAG